VQISLGRFSCYPVGADNNLNALAVEDIDGSTTHSALNNDIDAPVIQEVWQESRRVSRVCYGLTLNNLITFGFKDIEVRTVSKVFCYHLIFTRYCYFHFLLSVFV